MDFSVLSTKETQAALLSWYQNNKRDLIWRCNPTPYMVWISEIMLQQTRVAAVIPYYLRFMSELPSIDALAVCPEEKLLKLWEGLGYYSRARNLKKAAQIIMRDFQGQLPRDYKSLLSLPGIGSYTAGAILSFAYHLPYPAIDGNLLRVLSRITQDERNILDPRLKREYEESLAKIIPTKEPHLFNYALMELGASVCGPDQAPECAICPCNSICLASLNQKTATIPKRAPLRERKIEYRTVIVIENDAQLLLHKRPPKGLLASLYEFPNELGHLSVPNVQKYVEHLGFAPIRITPLKSSHHIFTHLRWEMIGYKVTIAQDVIPLENDNPQSYFLVDKKTIYEHYSIPSAFSCYKNSFITE